MSSIISIRYVADRANAVLGKRRSCSRLSQRLSLVEERGLAVSVPSACHESGVCWKITGSPCSGSSVEILVHDCAVSASALNTASDINEDVPFALPAAVFLA